MGGFSLKTRVTELFGIEYPIIQAGMSWASEGKLAGAVSEAGGLGLIGSATMSVEKLTAEIAVARGITSKPFGVNITLLRPDAVEVVDAVIREGIRIVFSSAGNPKLFTVKLKGAGITLAHVVPAARLARKAVEAGVDVVVAEGFEAGGHDGVDEIPTLVLVPQVAEAVDVPVIAAGGIVDGRTALAALALGAEGVQMGTRFLATTENNAPEIYKKMLVEAGETDTVFLRGFHPMRVFRTPFARKLFEAQEAGATRQEIADLAGPGRGFKGMMEGNVEEGLFNCGAGVGLIREVKPAADVIRDIVADMRAGLKRLGRMGREG